MEMISRQRELAIKLNILDSRIAKNQILLNKFRRRRSRHLQLMQVIQIQQYHLALALENSRVWSYSEETTYWEVDVQNMSEELFKEIFRMYRKSFFLLCELISTMAKTDSKFRKCIPLEKRVAIVLYALATSDNYNTIGKLFGVGKSTVYEIIMNFCETLWHGVSPKYLPSKFVTNERVEECVNGFQELTNLPQCFGAVDGCHIDIAPTSNTEYLNSRGGHSMILLALVDHNHRFLYINVGSPGSWTTASVYEKSRLPQLFSGELLQDHAKHINGTEVPVFIIGDSSFGLSEHLMKPFPFSIGASDPEIVFNKILLKCHTKVDETFKYLKARFGRLGKSIGNHIPNTRKIIQACCVLHNFLSVENDEIDDQWIENQLNFEKSCQMQQAEEFESLNFNSRADEIRNSLANYIYNLNENKNF